MHESLERFGRLGVITLLSRLTKFVRGSFSIDAPDNIMELGSCEDTEVSVFNLEDVQSSSHGFDKSDTRRTCVTAKDHLSRALVNLPQLIDQLFVDQLLVRLTKVFGRSVGKSRSITFPVLLRHVSSITSRQSSLLTSNISP